MLPDAAEEILLTKPSKKLPPDTQANFRLHYFPNIPLDPPSDDCGKEAQEVGFQRFYFADMEGACPDDNSASETPPGPEEDTGPCVEEIERNAYQHGFAEGEKAGFAAATQTVDPVIESLNQALRELQNIRQETQQQIETEVVKLALAIAKKIVCHEVKTSQETVACVAREALRQVQNPAKIKIKLNPSDLQFIQDTRTQISQYLHNVANVRFEAEDSIQSGGCVIETDMGDIDARIEKQFQAIEASFQTALSQPEQESE